MCGSLAILVGISMLDVDVDAGWLRTVDDRYRMCVMCDDQAKQSQKPITSLFF